MFVALLAHSYPIACTLLLSYLGVGLSTYLKIGTGVAITTEHIGLCRDGGYG